MQKIGPRFLTVIYESLYWGHVPVWRKPTGAGYRTDGHKAPGYGMRFRVSEA